MHEIKVFQFEDDSVSENKEYYNLLSRNEVGAVILNYEEEIEGALDYYWHCGEYGNEFHSPIPFKELETNVAEYLNKNKHFNYEFQKIALIETHKLYFLHDICFSIKYNNNNFEVELAPKDKAFLGKNKTWHYIDSRTNKVITVKEEDNMLPADFISKFIYEALS